MRFENSPESLHSAECKIERFCRNALQELPQSSVLAHTLKTLETQLQSKGMLALGDVQNHSPLWFIAETEQNVFLWRNGFSLSQRNEFEFWIDLQTLVRKRMAQLKTDVAGNPFTNPAWELRESAPEESAEIKIAREGELQYLVSILRAIEAIESHLHALSRVGSILEEEIRGHAKPRVLLPANI